MIKCYTGNNALDFQLVSYLGFMMKTGAKTQYIIVSNDTGYDAMVRFWNDRERNVSRLSQAELIRSVKQKTEKIPAKQEKQTDGEIEIEGEKAKNTESETVEAQILTLDNVWSEAAEWEYSDEEILIQGVLSDEKSREVISWIAQMLHKYSAKQLQQIHREMVKKYGQKEGGQMYKLIKPILKQFYQMQQVRPYDENQDQDQDQISIIEVMA